MEALLRNKKNCRLLRIDIDQWGSAVAKQYGINRLPTVWLYEGNAQVETGTSAALNRISQLD